MKPAIRIEGLSKEYRLGSLVGGEYRTLRESLTQGVARLFARKNSTTKESKQFWALKDVSFEVQPGEIVGIIGRNGAGKSTLLKILSRIVEPTSGHAEVRGRMGSLLEVGTGFHQELTGRENIFLNGSILGMSKREIERRFDEIVAFSEIEQFLDTPVKRYSSGMYVRLAFAVAAHLEPEILIVDEVLAVGDLGFQRKVLGRLQSLRSEGRTVLFVSHQMAALESLCTRGVFLEQGTLLLTGPITEIIEAYRARFNSSKSVAVVDLRESEAIRRQNRLFKTIKICDDGGNTTTIIPLASKVRFDIEIECPHSIISPSMGIGIDSILGQRMLTVHSPLSHDAIGEICGQVTITCEIPHFPLAPGDYSVKLALTERRCELDSVERALSFTVVEGQIANEGLGYHRGVCVAPSKWSIDGPATRR